MLYPINNQKELNLVCIIRKKLNDKDSIRTIIENTILKENRSLVNFFERDLKTWPIYTTVKPIKSIGSFLWKTGDEKTIDRFGPDGISKIVKAISNKAVKLQSGYIFDYAFVMLIGLSLLLTFSSKIFFSILNVYFF